MFAVLAEDKSDVDSLAVFVRRISGNPTLTIFKKGFSGCGELRRKAWGHMKAFGARGATRFIICHDSDGGDPQDIKDNVETVIRNKSCSGFDYSIVIPVQELEAWIIADEQAISKVIPSLTIKAVSSPELINSPKEWLIRESQKNRSHPLYVPTMHNARVAQHVDLCKLERKCPSFMGLKNFVSPPPKKS